MIAILAISMLAGPPAPMAAGWAKALFNELGHDWGKVERGVQLSRQFTIANRTQDTVRIRQLAVSCRCTTAMLSSYELRPGEQAVLDVQMDTSGFRGTKAVSVTVGFDRPKHGEVVLRVMATSGAMVPSEPEFDLGRIPAGRTASAERRLTLTGEPGWTVSAIDFANPELHATAVEVSRTGGQVVYSLAVRLEAGTTGGAFRDVIRLHTTRKDKPLVEVPVRAEIETVLRASPELITVPTDPTNATVVLKAATPFRVVRVEGLDGERLAAKGGQTPRSVQVLQLRIAVPPDEALPAKLVFRTDLPSGEIAEVRLVR